MVTIGKSFGIHPDPGSGHPGWTPPPIKEALGPDARHKAAFQGAGQHLSGLGKTSGEEEGWGTRPQAAQPTPVWLLAEVGPCGALSLHSVHGTGEGTLIHAWGTLCWTEPRAVTACTEHLVAVQGLGYTSSSTHRVHLLGTADTERWE